MGLVRKSLVALLLLATLESLNGEMLPQRRRDIGCFVIGECQNSNPLGVKSMPSAADCLDFCAGTAGCKYFTHHSADDVCFAHSDCPVFDENGCQGQCVSGDEVCSDIECNIEGQCEGKVIDYQFEDSKATCINHCHSLNGCSYWSFNSANGLCITFEICGSVNNCKTCVSGHHLCPENTPSSRELVALSYNSQHRNMETSLVLPNNENKKNLETQNCGLGNIEVPTDFPQSLEGYSATTLNGNVILCSGETCWVWDHETLEWNHAADLQEERQGSHLLAVKDQEIWITGGQKGGVPTATTEMYYPGSDVTSQGPDLPYKTAGHCMAVVNNTHVALLGGQTEAGGEAASNSFYLYNLNTNEWTSLPALPTGRMGHICEIIDTSKGPELVVAGGSHGSIVTDRFNFAEKKWRSGPQLPQPISEATSYNHLSKDGANSKITIVGKSINNKNVAFDIYIVNWSVKFADIEIPAENQFVSFLKVSRDLLLNCDS